MNKGKVLKARPGHDANCSSSAYIGYILVNFAAYGALLLVLVVAQVALRAQRLADKPWLNKLKLGLWIVPHLLGIGVTLFLGVESGAMNYGSSVCVGMVVLMMLIGMGVGWAKIAAKQEAAQKEAWILCPNCGYQAGSRSAWTCPECGFDLTAGRLALFERRVAAGLCPKCGEAVASTAQNCPSCRINLAWARENLRELAE